jgi:ABC-type transport system involved in cytochrome c biogenesis permease component
MTSDSSIAKVMTRRRGLVEEMQIHGWSWKSGGVVFGLFGGMVCSVLGSILTAMAWITGPEWHGLLIQRGGAVLLFLTIPLLIFGAHCLDLTDKQNQTLKSPVFK